MLNVRGVIEDAGQGWIEVRLTTGGVLTLRAEMPNVPLNPDTPVVVEIHDAYA